MKVYEGQGPIFQEANKNTNKKASKEGDFQKIMDQIHSRPERIEKVTDKENPMSISEGINILHETEQINRQIDVVGKMQMLREIQETLDLVDFYSQKLADSSIPITGLDNLISNLEGRLDTLQNMESSPRIPKQLKAVISDMAITIGAEVTKFKRGDYQ